VSIVLHQWGTALVATASNPTDVTAGLTWGPPLSIPQFLAMATGDLNGDGQPEILGVYWTSGPSPDLVLAIYTVDPQTLAVTLANTVDLSGPLNNNFLRPNFGVSIRGARTKRVKS
jgi:hypothetical protein